ncbi:MAG: PilZ domain-containing protein [Syntrophaceae bacterium]|nr:PilZ domain-containing protein [Syntrophaceae bacterium]
MKTPDLKVGTRVTIVFENEINRSNAHYIKALVYDYENDNIVISQTTPALNRHFLNRRIRVTFLAKIEKRFVRFGFRAQLIDLITDYEISSNKYVEALILKQYETPEEMDFRMHFRIKPPSQSRINLSFQEEKINLIDISLGGAQFACSKSYLFLRGDSINVKLTIDDKEFDLKARVRNIFIPYEYSAHNSIQYVSVEFKYKNLQLETTLGRAIIEIERKLLSEGKI